MLGVTVTVAVAVVRAAALSGCASPHQAERQRMDDALTALPGVEDVIVSWTEGTFIKEGQTWCTAQVHLRDDATVSEAVDVIRSYLALPVVSTDWRGSETDSWPWPVDNAVILHVSSGGDGGFSVPYSVRASALESAEFKRALQHWLDGHGEENMEFDD